jgi:hypothetical protein
MLTALVPGQLGAVAVALLASARWHLPPALAPVSAGIVARRAGGDAERRPRRRQARARRIVGTARNATNARSVFRA